MKLQRNVRRTAYFLTAYLFECVSFVYASSPIVLLRLFFCVSACVSVVYLKYTRFSLRSYNNLRITGSIDVRTNYDYSVSVFRLDEPVRQSRVRWVPISLLHWCSRFAEKYWPEIFSSLGESILKTRLFSKLLLISYNVRFAQSFETKIRVNSKKVRTKFRIRIGANLFPSVRRCHIWQPYFRT